MLRIGIITDIHHGPDRGTKKGSAAIGLLQAFVDWLTQASPDFVVEMGDRISDVDHETDRRLARDVARMFKKITVPRAHLLGNHDVHLLGVSANEEIYGLSFKSWSKDLLGYRLIFWNPDVRLDDKTGFDADPLALKWLEAELAEAPYPVVLFSHVPLGGGSMVGNYYFENTYAHQTEYPNGADIRAIIELSSKVILCVNGHTHWNALHTIDGIHYVTIPSLTEIFTTYPHPNEAWAELRLDDRTIEVEVFGRTPILYRLPVRQMDQHWVNVDKDYAPDHNKPR